jgi:hypothetical protein
MSHDAAPRRSWRAFVMTIWARQFRTAEHRSDVAMSRFSDRGRGPRAPRPYAAATILPAPLPSFFLSSASGTGGL